MSNLNGNGIASAVVTSKTSGGKSAPVTTSANTVPKTGPVIPKPAPTKGPKYGEAIAELRERQFATDNKLSDIASAIQGLVGSVGLLSKQVAGQAADQPVAGPTADEIIEIIDQPVAGPTADEIIDDDDSDSEEQFERELLATLAELQARRAGKVTSGVQTVKAVSYPDHKQGVTNALASATVVKQATDAKAVGHTMRLPAGAIPHRDYTIHPVDVEKRDSFGKPVIDKRTGLPETETVKARCHPETRAYIESACNAEMPSLELWLVHDGKPTGAKMPLRFVTSQRSGNPQFVCKDACFSVVDSNGNIFEFAGGGRGGVFYGLKGYSGAEIISARSGRTVTRRDAA